MIYLTFLMRRCTLFFSFPDLKQLQSLQGHTANCICIKFDPTGKYFATGSADALVNLWDLSEMVVVRTFSRYFHFCCDFIYISSFCSLFVCMPVFAVASTTTVVPEF